jgi:adenylate cyclase
VLRQYHRMMGEQIFAHGGTLEHFAGDGMMIFFNDPVPQDDHVERAVRMTLAMRERFAELAADWPRHGYGLGFGVGIASGYATLGRIGFEGRYDYGMVGTAVIMAQRLSAVAAPGQILLSPESHADVRDILDVESVGELQLKGFSKPVVAVNVLGFRAGTGERLKVVVEAS